MKKAGRKKSTLKKLYYKRQNLIQTNKIPRAPIILVGVSHWTPLEKFFKEVLLESKMIEEEDLSLYTITDNEDQILEIIKKTPVRIGLRYDENLDKTPKNNSASNSDSASPAQFTATNGPLLRGPL